MSQDEIDQEDPLQGLHWRDEILEVMYWLRVQGSKMEITTSDLLTFLDLDGLKMRRHLDRLVKEGYIESIGVDDRQSSQAPYRLTDMGHREAKRRFVDDFNPLGAHHNHDDCPSESPCRQDSSKGSTPEFSRRPSVGQGAVAYQSTPKDRS